MKIPSAKPGGVPPTQPPTGGTQPPPPPPPDLPTGGDPVTIWWSTPDVTIPVTTPPTPTVATVPPHTHAPLPTVVPPEPGRYLMSWPFLIYGDIVDAFIGTMTPQLWQLGAEGHFITGSVNPTDPATRAKPITEGLAAEAIYQAHDRLINYEFGSVGGNGANVGLPNPPVVVVAIAPTAPGALNKYVTVASPVPNTIVNPTSISAS